MSDLLFRPLAESDLAELSRWHQDPELANRYGGSDWPKKVWEIMRKDSNRQCSIVSRDDEPIGYVDIELHPDEHLMWIGIAVKPELRKQGIGKKILETFLSTPIVQQYREVWAGIEHDNVASRRCFESVGFTAKNSEPDEEGIIDYVLVR